MDRSTGHVDNLILCCWCPCSICLQLVRLPSFPPLAHAAAHWNRGPQHIFVRTMGCVLSRSYSVSECVWLGLWHGKITMECARGRQSSFPLLVPILHEGTAHLTTKTANACTY